jgi:hypothetical protein
MTMNPHQPIPRVTDSAAAHAERIQARDKAKAKAKAQRGPADDRQTCEIYAERALAGARADEALREQARKNEARARGEWVPGEEPDVEEEVEEEPTDFDPTDSPERRSAKVAWRSASTGGYLAL